MNIVLICPFRTLVNLNTDVAYANAVLVHDILLRVCEEVSLVRGIHYSASRTPPEEIAYIKYSDLDFDHRTWTSTPLSEVRLNDAEQEFINVGIEKELELAQQKFLKTSSIEVSIFDNTVAIATISLDFDVKNAASKFSSPNEIEKFLTEYSASMCRHLQKEVVTPFLLSLVEVCKNVWMRREKIVRKSDEFIVFNDVSDHPYPHWNSARECMVWSHRILDMTTVAEDEKPLLEKLIRVKSMPEDCFYYIRWGTSYILEKGRYKKFIEMNVASQYFYTLFDAHGNSQKRFLRQIIREESMVKIKRINTHFDRQESLIAEGKSDYIDYLGGLQDLNAEIFKDIRDSFETEGLMDALATRSEMIQNRINRVSKTRKITQQRFLNFILVLLGSTQLLGLMINLFIFTEQSSNDDWYGILDLVESFPPDLAINLFAITTVLCGFFWSVYKGRSK